jgi:predicted double-glycine peptidase
MLRALLRKPCAFVCLLFALSVSPGICHAEVLPVLLGAEALRLFHQGERLGAERKRDVIIQTSEYTCGPAAVAALLKFYFGDNTNEQEIAQLAGTYENHTTTLLDLRNACRAKGYEASGYRMTLPQLLREIETSGVPVLVHFKEPSLHYALVLGQVGDVILVSDPSWGHVSIDVTDFLRRWSKNALVVKSSRPAHRELIERRKQSAETRLATLSRVDLSRVSPRY